MSQMLIAKVPRITVSLDGGEPLTALDATFHAAPYTMLRSYTAVLPDPAWVHTDSNGHEHRWAQTGRRIDQAAALPTLTPTSVHVECDGSCPHDDCDGYDRTEWHCAACGELVEPGYVPDYQMRGSGVPLVTGEPSAELHSLNAGAELRTTLNVTLIDTAP